MTRSKTILNRLISALGGDASPPRRRRNYRATPMLVGLEDRLVLSHGGLHHHHLHALATSASVLTSTTTTASGTTAGTTSTTTNTALAAAEKTLQNDIQTIEASSNTTIGQLTAIRAAFQTISTDGLTPTSAAALSSFEDGLVTTNASGTTLAGNATVLAQFEALYTSSPTTQETTNLTTAYNALAAAVTSSNITSADISTIIAD